MANPPDPWDETFISSAYSFSALMAILRANDPLTVGFESKFLSKF
jgi:hypothetical protein